LYGITVYAAMTIIAATAAFLFSEWVREPGAPAPERLGLTSLAAGLLWPVLLIGILQCLAVAVVQSRLRVTTNPIVPSREDARA
jgi:hypothetical protein